MLEVTLGREGRDGKRRVQLRGSRVWLSSCQVGEEIWEVGSFLACMASNRDRDDSWKGRLISFPARPASCVPLSGS